ncbi:acyl-CoA thioesterase [Arsenicitalea aurantiaca]|uniref:Acyl-CoA thioesterase n=1 Tax=Arsenicitalea aurantiaca TaxID=1783274 RepID=A0A433XL73_9HYPH|nr:acyl-CoA thioesterase [Arsenicitalea aurantiaca]RUT34832.1 acyl-CoA thioesterase [Arsenicitalea aurantiaca]
MNQHGVTTFAGVAHPFMCDVTGHMSARHYMAMFDDATLAILGMIGDRESALAARTGWADVRCEIDYRQEVEPGSLITIQSRVVRLGRSSVTLGHEMIGSIDRLARAQALVVTVHFDLVARQAIPMPEDLRRRAEALVIG